MRGYMAENLRQKVIHSARSLKDRTFTGVRDLATPYLGIVDPQQIPAETFDRTAKILDAFSIKHDVTANYTIANGIHGYYVDYLGEYQKILARSTTDIDELVMMGNTLVEGLGQFVSPFPKNNATPLTDAQALVGTSDYKRQLIVHLMTGVYLGEIGDAVKRLQEGGIAKDVETLFELQNSVLNALSTTEPKVVRNWISSRGSSSPGNIFEKTPDKVELVEVALRLQTRRDLEKLNTNPAGADEQLAAILGGHKAALEGRYLDLLSDDPDKRMSAMQGIMKNDFLVTSMRSIVQLQAGLDDPKFIGVSAKAKTKNTRKAAGIARKDTGFHGALANAIIPSESLLNARVVHVRNDKPQLQRALTDLFLTESESAREDDQVQFSGISAYDAMFNRTRDILPIKCPQATTDLNTYGQDRVEISDQGAYAQENTEFHLTRAQTAVGMAEHALSKPEDPVLADHAAAYLTYVTTDLSTEVGEINQFKSEGRHAIANELISLHLKPNTPAVLRQAVNHALQEIAANWDEVDQQYIVDSFLSAGGASPDRLLGEGRLGDFLIRLAYLTPDSVPNIPNNERVTPVTSYIRERMRNRIRNYASWDNGTTGNRSIYRELQTYEILKSEVIVVDQPTVADAQRFAQHLQMMSQVDSSLKVVRTLAEKWGGAFTSLSTSELTTENKTPIALNVYIANKNLSPENINMVTWEEDMRTYRHELSKLRRRAPRMLLYDIVDIAKFAANAEEMQDLALAIGETVTAELEELLSPQVTVELFDRETDEKLRRLTEDVGELTSPEALAALIGQTNVAGAITTIRNNASLGPSLVQNGLAKTIETELLARIEQINVNDLLPHVSTVRSQEEATQAAIWNVLAPIYTSSSPENGTGENGTAGAVQQVMKMLNGSGMINAKVATALSAGNTHAELSQAVGSTVGEMFTARRQTLQVLQRTITAIAELTYETLTDSKTLDTDMKDKIKKALFKQFTTGMDYITDTLQAMEDLQFAQSSSIRARAKLARDIAGSVEARAAERAFYVKQARGLVTNLLHLDPKYVGERALIEEEKKKKKQTN